MTAKEKAEELVGRYNYNNKHYLMLDAKQCALIAQKNLLNKLKELNIVDEFEEEVLFEINAL